jgi:uncharacterized membrane protein YvlD (DUF360 family)
MILEMNIEWIEVVKPAKGPRERRIKSLGTTIIRSLFLGVFSFFIGVVAMIFIAQHLNQPKLELDSFIGKIFSGVIILSAVGVIIFGSKASNAWTKKKRLL